MIFTELRFLAFFGLVLGVYWLLRENRPRKVWLLLASYAFYAGWDWRFLGLIWVSTLIDYVAGRAIGATTSPRRRRAWMLLSLASNLGILGFFKYFNFFVDSAVHFLGWLGLGASPPALAIVLPVGISFYTFQTLSYTLDVYAGRLQPTRDLLDLALFVAFFPQLVAGPIVRASGFLPQLEGPRRFADVALRSCLTLFLLGFLKKACVSDNVAAVIDPYFRSPGDFTAASAWLALALYAVQLYCDFSGYSDMAIATAGLLGYELGPNFNFPYFAANVAEFWHRWHISLSTWLRDYLYIPLGGSHGSTLFRYRNLMLTMLLGGLWHGASWRFVIWGGLHGLALVVHREWQRRRPARWSRPGIPGIAAGIVLTFAFWCVTMIFFRAQSLQDAGLITSAALLGQGAGTQALSALYLGPLVGLAIAHALAYRRVLAGPWQRAPAWVFGLVYGAAVALALAFLNVDVRPFVYFQF